MRILLVNDDGYGAKGIVDLYNVLKEYGDVVICAPKTQQSGKSCAINVSYKFDFEEIDDHNFLVDGSPADCVNFMMVNRNEMFDLVVSGANEGLNFSIFSVWSGTIGACLQASMLNVPSIAFSCHHKRLEQTKKYSKQVLDFIFNNNLLINKDTILSVNFPNVEEVKGIKISNLSYNSHNLQINKDLDLTTLNNDFNFEDENSDLNHIYNGYISIAPIKGNLQDKDTFLVLTKKI